MKKKDGEMALPEIKLPLWLLPRKGGGGRGGRVTDTKEGRSRARP